MVSLFSFFLISENKFLYHIYLPSLSFWLLGREGLMSGIEFPKKMCAASVGK